MGCGATKGIVEICTTPHGTVQLSRCFSYSCPPISPQVERNYDDRLLLRGCNEPPSLKDEEVLSDITVNLCAEDSMAPVTQCVSSFFHRDNLELRRQEEPASLEEDMFVYDDAVVPKSEAQTKHWLIEGRRPLVSTSSRSKSFDGKNSSRGIFFFTDFEVCVDEVELNLKEVAEETSCFNNGKQLWLRRMKVTRTFSNEPNTVAARLRVEEKTQQLPICRQLKHFTVENFIGHSARVKSISILPNGHSFASCSAEDASVVLHSLRSSSGGCIFTGHLDLVLCIAVSPDGKYLATTSKDGTMLLWDASVGKKIHTLNHDKVVLCCCFSQDSRIAVSGSQDRICRLWDVREAALLLLYNQHGGIIVSLAYSPNGNYVCSTSADKTLHVWSAKTGKNHLKLEGHSGMVLSCSYTPNGEYIVSNDETYLVIWRASDGSRKLRLAVTDVVQIPRDVSFNKKLVWCCSCAAPGSFVNYAVAACNNRFVYIFDILSGDEIGYVICKAPVSCLTSGAKNKIAFGDRFGNIYVQTLF